MLCSKRTTKLSGVERKGLHKELYIQNKNPLLASLLGGSSPSAVRGVTAMLACRPNVTAGSREYSWKSPGPLILFATSEVDTQQVTFVNDWNLFKTLIKEAATFEGDDDRSFVTQNNKRLSIQLHSKDWSTMGRRWHRGERRKKRFPCSETTTHYNKRVVK